MLFEWFSFLLILSKGEQRNQLKCLPEFDNSLFIYHTSALVMKWNIIRKKHLYLSGLKIEVLCYAFLILRFKFFEKTLYCYQLQLGS